MSPVFQVHHKGNENRSPSLQGKPKRPSSNSLISLKDLTSPMASSSGTNTSDEELLGVLSEQRMELVMDSDYDLAFNLQMEEAFNASNSSSASLSSQMLEPVPVPVLTNDDVFDFNKLIVDEIDRLYQEYHDRELSEAESRRMRDDLKRRIHDQKVATDILNIPEEWWAVHGDNFEKPYDVGVSDIRVAMESEDFRVHFKGLVSEERVKDSMVRVSGIGIAVCDPRDNVLLEVTKPLLDDNELTSTVRWGFHALIEGLQAAIDLGLKRITCFTDDYMIHQYVMAKQPLTDITTSSLDMKVLGLRMKFTHFNLVHVARNKLKFAFKLARDAIVSQINWPAESESGRKLMETCVICLDDVGVDEMFSIDGCLHRYCFSCMKQHVEVKLLNGQLAECPHEGCKSSVVIERCKSFLEPKFVDIMSQKLKEASVPVTEKVYCPYPRCSTFMSKREALEYTANSLMDGAELTGMRKCKKCFKLFCINCMVPWHNNMNCDYFRKVNKNPDAEDVKLKSLAYKQKWRQCVKCKYMIELSEGCYHIYCRCGYQFCYTCGAEWINKKATCSCPIWDERNILRG